MSRLELKLTRRTLAICAKEAEFTYPEQNLKLANAMVELMRDEQGIGLASTQVGQRVRLFVMEIDQKTWHCFNPQILGCGEIEEPFDEGCLSFPGDSCIISRPTEIVVQYKDAHGISIEELLTGLPARCFQHELDHLNGITMWDRYEEQNAKQPRD